MTAPGNQLFAARLQLEEETCGDGRRVFRSSTPFPADRPDIWTRLRHWAAIDPERVLLSEPRDDGRRTIRYGEALALASALGALLTSRFGLRRGDRIATLAPAGVDALGLKLACLAGGFVHVALPPYPFSDGKPTPANGGLLAAARPALLVASPDHPARRGLGAFDLASLVAEASAGPAAPPPAEGPPDEWAAIFFTSGSSGDPKGVAITRGMISSNQAAIAALWPFVAERAPVLVDWLPWHHVFGGLDNIFKTIWNGGAMHVDATPSAASMAATVRLMALTAPTLHIAVPLGLKALLDEFERDETMARAATRHLRAIFFAGAGIEAPLWRRLRAFRDKLASFEILSGYGATEAASTICLSAAPLEEPGEIGYPLPGHDVALVETGGRLELRVRGPNVAPAYLTESGVAPLPLDEQGFYRTGDAALLRRRADGVDTLAFDGRLSDDFKMSSGVKVRAGALRARLIAHCAPLIEDIVISGEDRDCLVALVFPAPLAAREAGKIEKTSRALATWNAANPARSTRIARFALAEAPPDRERGEVSDKRQIVRGRFLKNHADLFAALHDGAGLSPDA